MNNIFEGFELRQAFERSNYDVNNISGNGCIYDLKKLVTPNCQVYYYNSPTMNCQMCTITQVDNIRDATKEQLTALFAYVYMVLNKNTLLLDVYIENIDSIINKIFKKEYKLVDQNYTNTTRSKMNITLINLKEWYAELSEDVKLKYK